MITLLDRFVRRHLPLDDETLSRARITVGLLISNIAFLSLLTLGLGGFIGLADHEIDPTFTLQVLLATIPTMLLYVGSLWHFSRTLAFTPASNTFLITQWGIVIAAVLMTGGAPASPMTSLLVVVMLYAFLLLGRRGGLYWTAVTIASLLALIAMNAADIGFAVVSTQSLMQTYDMIAPLLLMVASTSALLFYEYMTKRLRLNLVAERNQLAWQATHDPLTRLLNREEFQRSLQRALQQSTITNLPCAVLYIDLDRFKPINDQHGHAVGDAVLCEVATRLRHSVRDADIVARLGGDEFAVILTAMKDLHYTTAIAAKLQQQLTAPIIHNGITLGVDASIGIAVYPKHATTAGDLLMRADLAMYQDKYSRRSHSGGDNA